MTGCGANDTSCTVKATAATHGYVVGCINGNSRQGPWTSCDYYAAVGKLGKLSVTDVTAAIDPRSVDVQVSFQDGSNGSAACDPDATYSFSDAALESTAKLGDCHFRLTFDQPATGIYDIALTASSESSGEAAQVSKDQYGEKVDGTFPVVVDSCKRPSEDVPDVDALDNSGDRTCAVLVGDWDSDVSSIPSTVLTDEQNSSDFDLNPVPVESVDPSDWSAKDLALFEKNGTGYIATGEGVVIAGTGEPEAGSGLDIGVVDKLWPPGVPHNWNGSGAPLTADQIANDAPQVNGADVYVISGHGGWFTGSGLVRVPDGDSVTTFVPIGTSMGLDGIPGNKELGVRVDTGDFSGDDTKYMHTYTAGQLMPDFTFMYYGGTVGAHAHPMQQGSPMTLNALLTPNEGPVWLSACATLYVPTGEPLADALSLLPIYTPGSAAPTGWASATITNGQLHTSQLRDEAGP